MAMARNYSVFAFLTLFSFLCVSALAEREEVEEIAVDQILRLPSQSDSGIQTIPWEQTPIEIESIPLEGIPIEVHMPRIPRRPMFGEDEMEMDRHRPRGSRFGRFGIGRPGGCHGKFKHFLMPREDPFHPYFSRRMKMGMGHHRHGHALEFLRGDERASSRAFGVDFNPEREAMGFEKQQSGHREGVFKDGMVMAEIAEVEKENEQERGASWLNPAFSGHREGVFKDGMVMAEIPEVEKENEQERGALG